MDNENIAHIRDVKIVIEQLRTLGYSFENEKFEFVNTLLVTHSTSRNELLFWCLKIPRFSYTLNEQKLFNHTVRNQILSDLLSLGICSSHDINSIDCSASSSVQRKFWLNLLEVCLKVKYKPNSDLDYVADDLVYSLVHSSHFQESLKDGDLNLLPKDIQIMYKARNKNKKEANVSHQISSLSQQETLLQDSSNCALDPGVDESRVSPSSLVLSFASLANTNKCLTTVHHNSLLPWCKLSSSAPPSHYNVRELVARMYQEVKQLQKSMEVCGVLEENHECVIRLIDKLKQEQQNGAGASKVMDSVLKSL